MKERERGGGRGKGGQAMGACFTSPCSFMHVGKEMDKTVDK